jgi:hypothetical protein
MKTKQITGLFAIACASIYFFSCSNGSSTSKMLVNKWQIESFKSTDFDKEMTNLKQMADTTKDTMMKSQVAQRMQMEQAIMEALKNSVIEYKADSTFEMKVSFMGQAQTNKGKWILLEDKDSKRLIQTDDKQKKDTMIISDISADKFTVTSPDKSVTVVYKPAPKS